MKEIEDIRVEYQDVTAESAVGELPAERFSPSARSAWREHLRHYLPPLDYCPLCGTSSRYAQWGVVHGKMICPECGYPATTYHFVGEPKQRVVMFLWAHPSEVERNA